MSETMHFDTHKFVKRMTETGMAEATAEALADEQMKLIQGELATKQDLALVHKDIEELRTATQQDLALVHKDIEQLRKETKQDLALVHKDIEELRKESKQNIEQLRKETKQDLAETKVELLKWGLGALLAHAALLITVIKLP